MVNSKAVVLLIVASVLVAAIAGIAFAQYASAQANASRGVAYQTPQGSYGGYYPQQGYPSGSGQYGSAYGYGGMGMGMCGRFW